MIVRIIVVIIVAFNILQAQFILIPMDLKQTDHLKSYGMAYWILEQNVNVEWLLNYRGGSFLFPHSSIFESECRLRGIFFETISSVQVNSIYATIEENNMEKRNLINGSLSTTRIRIGSPFLSLGIIRLSSFL